MGTYTNLINNDSQPPVDRQHSEVVSPTLAHDPERQVKKPVVRKQTSVQANKHVRKQTSKRANVHVTMQAFVEKYLDEKATQGFTFRYPPQLLEELEDAIYEIRKQHRKKLSKNAIAVLALAYVLKDYLDSGEDSVLFRMLIAAD